MSLAETHAQVASPATGPKLNVEAGPAGGEFTGLVPGQPAPAVKPIKERIDSGWLVEEVDEHTCGGPVNGMHEPGCGLVPLVDLSTLPGWDVLKAKVKAEALREWIDGWPTTPDDGTFLASVARDGRARADELERGEGR